MRKLKKAVRAKDKKNLLAINELKTKNSLMKNSLDTNKNINSSENSMSLANDFII